MTTITGDGWAQVPVDKAFDYMAELSNATAWFHGATKFEPMTELTRGLGSTFDVILNIGIPIKAVIKCTEYVENDHFVMETIKGPWHRSTWTFVPENGGTRMYGKFEYSLPGGIAGAAIGKLAGPFVKIAIDKITRNLVEQTSAL